MNAHNPPQTNAQAALALAAAGIAIFPCGPNKRPIFKGWRTDSTCDIATVIKTWRAHPNALIGLDCGKSRLVAVDLDRHGNGDGVSPFHDKFGHPEDFGAPIIATPNDGAHIFFKAPEGMTIRNSASKLAGGIDVRGDGGYAIGVGSTLPDGRGWRHGFGPELPEAFDAGTLPVLPQAIIDAILVSQKPEKPQEAPRGSSSTPSAGDGSRERSWALAKLSAREKELAQTREGGRNQALNDAAYSLGRVVARNWISESEARAALEAACVANGLWQSDGQPQCRKTIDSGLRAGMARPHEDLPEREAAQVVDEDALRSGEEMIQDKIARASTRESSLDDEDADDAPLSPAPVADRDELPDHLTHPPGVLGKIIDYIVDSAQRPNRIIATGASIAVLATVIGRRVAGPTKSGTHIYCAALAPSAAGKDHPQKRAADLLRAVNDRLVGPGEFTSQNALVRFMTGQQLSLCVIDEFGAYLGRICHSRASTWERNTTKSLREYWGSSFETVAPMAWATCATDPIKWPALSILGSSTHDEFFSALSSKEAVNGFLNRFLMVATMSKVVVVDEPSASKNEIPQPIIDTLVSLYSHCVGDTDDPITNKLIADQSLLDANRQIPIAWGDASVRAEFRALEKLALDKAENATIGELYGRTAEMALRLATIHAVSRAGLRAKVTSEDFAWGRELAMWSANTMAREASMRLADNESQARAKHVLRVIYEAGGTIKHRDLNRKLAHRLKPSDLRDTILSLQNSGEIGERRTQNPKGGPAIVTYVTRRQ
jgi:hypothetical protein